jgi:hypothetical protein
MIVKSELYNFVLDEWESSDKNNKNINKNTPNSTKLTLSFIKDLILITSNFFPTRK